MNDLSEESIAKLKARHPGLHPLIFHRSVERARSVSNLFDILESIPKLPVVWDEDKRAWTKVTDLVGHKKLKKK